MVRKRKHHKIPERKWAQNLKYHLQIDTNIEKQSYFSICKYYALKEISDWRFEKERKGEEAPRAVTILKMLFFELKFYIYLIIKWLQVDLNTQKKIQIYFLEISDLC